MVTCPEKIANILKVEKDFDLGLSSVVDPDSLNPDLFTDPNPAFQVNPDTDSDTDPGF